MSGLPEVIEGAIRRVRRFTDLRLTVSFGGTPVEVSSSGLVRIGAKPDSASAIEWWRDVMAIAEHLHAHHAEVAKLLGVEVEIPF